ncbi:hypothetical protein V496_04773, partial [Pseudogymnoascus sp. VKM F-4515 (FW-2607)]
AYAQTVSYTGTPTATTTTTTTPPTPRKRPPDRALACPGDKKAWPAWWVGEKMATAAATTTSEWVDG